MKTRRAVLVEPERFEIQEIEGEPKEDEVLIKVCSCGLCNWELNHWKGFLGTYPQQIGHEWNGTVVACGEKITKFKPGDTVVFCPLGNSSPGFTEYATAKESSLIKLSDRFELKYALGEPVECVTTVLRATRPEPGDYGVIIGAGPMGLWCTSVLRGNSLSGIIVIDQNDERLELARSFGADHIINSRSEDAAARIAEITGGHMADFVIEGTGIPELLESGINYIRRGKGRLVLMSSHERAARSFDFREFITRCPEIIIAHQRYSTDPADDFRRAIILYEKGIFRIDELVTHEFKLEDINEAFRTLEHKPADYIKGIVIP